MEYQMCVSLGMGGYCDCGDSEAWKRDPCCAAHHPAAGPQPAAAARPELAGKAALVFSAAVQYALCVFTPDASLMKMVPLDLDLGREHYPTRNVRYAATLYNFGVSVYDKVAETITSCTRCSPEEARAAAAAVRREGVAILHYSDFNGADEMRKRLKLDQHRSLRRTEIHVVHAHVVAHQRFVLRLVRHLRQLLEDRPALRPIFSAVMAETVGGSGSLPCLLERLMACDSRQWKQMRHETHLLLIQGMLMDIESKKFFAEVFTSRYQEQTLDSLPCRVQEQGTVLDLSVQIYTVPSIAHHLLAHHNALAVVLGTMVDECSTYTHGGQLVLRDVSSDVDARRRFDRQLSCLMDARYLLSVVPDERSEAVRAGVRRGLDALLELLFFCEGMEPVVRAQTAHVLYDTPYELQLTVAVSLAPLVTQLLEWCAADRQLLVYAYSAVLRKLHARLPPDKYFRRDRAALFGRSLSVSQYTVTTIPVSLELPLSRLFAGLHLHLAAHGLSYGSAEFASLPERVSPLQLLERPLRALVMDAQVRAGQWKRNGRSLEVMCSWYSLSMQVVDMRDRDLQMAQICASLLDSDEFVTTLMFRHGANLYLTAGAEGARLEDGADRDMREHMENNMADFLLLLIHVFGERFHPGVGEVTKEQCVQNEVIQFLCVKPMAHSQVAKRLPEADVSLLETAVHQVADFAVQEDHRGLRTYQLKPEYYSRYNCMWHHFSRHDRSQSERLQRKRRQETGDPSCLPPPSMPPFQPSLRSVRGVLVCHTTLHTMLAVLKRLTDAEPAAFSEAIFQRTLFLIGMALNEEERQVGQSAAFSFSEPAHQVGLDRALRQMVGSPRVSSHADLLAWVIAKLDRLLGRMQAQQKKFIAQNVAALAEEEERPAAEGGRLAAAGGGSAMDLSECAGAEEWPVCLGPRQTARPATAAEYTCILCQATEQVSSTRPAMVMAAFVQLSTVLSRDRSPAGEPPTLFVPASLHRLPHTSSCGHAMHAACWKAHFDSVARERRIHPRVHYLSGFDVQKQEFLCPLCQRLSNTVVPLVPDGTRRRPAGERPSGDHISVWLTGLLHASTLSARTARLCFGR
ncbi:E3 ubiquitin-protein ligase UBR2-like [Pollicipes pollicipes]|uniref:E3 ubiquitin-protein ligase UBR2-like n=1 Tax=Pollicipes pollicipes TaxID=41117 RepID=UPI001884BEA3|nr:E3 ubiquitin-protein ligase UBR2-like [Pollicipes pollicipes]